ncbi:hypothetical protein BGW42_006687 [Actinomortierella wolfii]|nr:hypothetical protein BGW42_006687 [Actinomortierella wolfii]
MLSSIREYRQRSRHSTKDGADSDTGKTSRKRKRSDRNGKEKPSIQLADSMEGTSVTDPEAPAILSHTFVGINSVTRLLEKSIQNIKEHPPPGIIFVCKGDLAPAHLYNHLATMAALLPSTLLFPLSKGAEARLSIAIGLRTVGAIGFKTGNRDVDDIVTVSSRMVQPLTVSWLPKITPPALPLSADQKASSDVEDKKKKTSLVAAPVSIPYVPTNIKTVQTTAPIMSKNDRAVKPKKDPSMSSQKEQQTGQKGQNSNQNNRKSGQKGS